MLKSHDPSRARLSPGVAGLLLIACTFLPLGCRNAANDTAAPDAAVAVTAAHPRTGPIAEQIAADAILAPLAEAALAPRVSSPIRAQYVQRGAHVHRGQLLLTLDDRDLRGAALDSQGGLEQARAAFVTATQASIPEETRKAQLDVEQARAELDVADRTATERKHLLAEGAIAGRETDLAVAQATQARATYELAVQRLHAVQTTTRLASTHSAEGQLTSAKGRYMSAEAQVAYANLRSPIDGVVTDRPYFVGETPPAGAPVITVMDTSSLLAKLHLSQAAAQSLTVGDTAEIRVPGIDNPLPATVSFLSPALDPGSTTVEVWLRLRNTDGQLKPGTPVHATLIGKTIANAITLPTSAILPASDGATAVMLVGADNIARKRIVKLGIRTPETVQVISGLTPADTVITQGSYGLDDGTRVRLGATAATTGSTD